MTKIAIYTAMAMTGRTCAEVRQEADLLVRVIENWGFTCLNPAIDEKIPYTQDIINAPAETLEPFWKRDKQMMRIADITMDYRTHNKSDGAVNEVGYSRYCIWHPTVRVWALPGGGISKLEDDIVVGSLTEAMVLITDKWGTVEKLAAWRSSMWQRCFPKWLEYQQELDRRYNLPKGINEMVK